jgi:hypothetical protein
MNPAALAAAGAGVGLRSARLQGAAGMLEPLRNPANWDNFRKATKIHEGAEKAGSNSPKGDGCKIVSTTMQTFVDHKPPTCTARFHRTDG